MNDSDTVTGEGNDSCIPVRVWVGYALPELRSDEGRANFYRKLGEIFIPATVQIMQPLGLTAYLPTVLPVDHNPLIPDEVALVFYPSCQSYEQARSSSTAGRAYQQLHSTLFNFKALNETPKSRSAFPLLFDKDKARACKSGSFSIFRNRVDWQAGNPVILVASYDAGDPVALRQSVIQRIAELQAEPPPGLDGLILFLCDDFVVVWAHWNLVPDEMNVLKEIYGLRVVINKKYRSAHLPMPVTTDFPGIPVDSGSSYNFRFSTISTD